MLKLVPVEELPKKKSYCQVETLILEFHESAEKIVEVQNIESHYASTRSAQQTFSQTAKRLRVPLVVRAINKRLYLIKI